MSIPVIQNSLLILILGVYLVQGFELIFWPVHSQFTTVELLKTGCNEPARAVLRGMIGSLPVAFGLCLLGTLISIGTFLLPMVVLLFPEAYLFMAPIQGGQSPVVTTLAVLCLAGGSVCTLFGVAAFRARGLTGHEEDSVLITSGIFGLCRNPISLGLLGIVAGFLLALPSWVGLCGTGIYGLNTHFRVKLEEGALEQRFGQAYRQYKHRVGRYFPKILPPLKCAE